MTLVFDTSTLSPFLENNSSVVRTFVECGATRVLIPLAVDAEIRFGFMNRSKPEVNLANYQRAKEHFGFEVFEPNQDTAIIYAELALWARQHGAAFSNNDLWIAATCVQEGAELLTHDADFRQLPQVRRVA